jgi:hypothetical protein
MRLYDHCTDGEPKARRGCAAAGTKARIGYAAAGTGARHGCAAARAGARCALAGTGPLGGYADAAAMTRTRSEPAPTGTTACLSHTPTGTPACLSHTPTGTPACRSHTPACHGHAATAAAGRRPCASVGAKG